MRTLLLVGRNSKPRSSHGTSILAVPGFPSGFVDDFSSTDAYRLDNDHLSLLTTVKADADAQSAAKTGSLIMVTQFVVVILLVDQIRL